ncbi:MAG: SBBP repeat-containing protein [Verrucomicrobiota bacterium]
MKTSTDNKLFFCTVILVLGIIGDSTVQAQLEGVPVWTKSGNANHTAQAMAVDGSGNVIVTGYSNDINGYSDYATIKYSGAGVALWTNRYNGPGNSYDYANAVVVDGKGNVFVTGDSDGDYLTIAYSGTGMALWTNRYNWPGNGTNQVHAVAVDTSGNVFVTGSSYGNGSSEDYATIKYSGAGVALWTNRYNGPGNGTDDAYAVAVDGSGNVFVTGSSTGTGSSEDYATIKYSGEGVALWTNRYNGPGNGEDQAYRMAVDGSGNVIVTGSSTGSGSWDDYATIKYSGSGVALWTNRYDGPGNRDDTPQAMAVDGGGNVLVTGNSSGTNDDHGAMIKYSGAGVPLWTNRYNGPGNYNDRVKAMAVDGAGNVFLTGYSTCCGSSYDYATIKYSTIPPSHTISPTTNLFSPAVWKTNLPSPVVINGQNTGTNPISGKLGTVARVSSNAEETKPRKKFIPGIATIAKIKIGYSTQEDLAKRWGKGQEMTGSHPNSGRLWRVEGTSWFLFTDGFNYSERGLVIDTFTIDFNSRHQKKVPPALLKAKDFAWLGEVTLGLPKDKVLEILKRNSLNTTPTKNGFEAHATGFFAASEVDYKTWNVNFNFTDGALSQLNISADDVRNPENLQN